MKLSTPCKILGTVFLTVFALANGQAQNATQAAQTALQIANDSATGTKPNRLAVLTSTGQVVAAATTDTTNIVGIVTQGAGKTGTAFIPQSGFAACDFDGPTTAKDYVIASTTTASLCHDAGSSQPVSVSVMGRVVATGSTTVFIFPVGVAAISGGAANSAGNPGQVQVAGPSGAFGAVDAKLSSFTNDQGFQTSAQLQSAITALNLASASQHPATDFDAAGVAATLSAAAQSAAVTAAGTATDSKIAALALSTASQKAAVTTVGTTGVDTAVPTEKAVRSAITALNLGTAATHPATDFVTPTSQQSQFAVSDPTAAPYTPCVQGTSPNLTFGGIPYICSGTAYVANPGPAVGTLAGTGVGVTGANGAPGSNVVIGQLPFTGAVQRTQNAMSADFATATTFGCVPDGTTDNSACLAKITTYANARVGSTIGFPCTIGGTYLMLSPWQLPISQVSLKSDQSCVISYAPASNPGTVVAAFNGIGANTLTIDGLGLQTTATFPPSTILTLGRLTSTGKGGTVTIQNSTIQGHATASLIYNISSENFKFHNNRVFPQGGGALSAYYTSSLDDLSVCGGTCQTGNSNLSQFITNNVWGDTSCQAGFFMITDQIGGATGEHYYDKGYVGLCGTNNGGPIATQGAFKFKSGAASQGGPNANIRVANYYTENGGYYVYFALNSQTAVYNVDLQGRYSSTAEQYGIYGDTGLSVNMSTLRLNNASPSTRVSSADNVAYSTIELTGILTESFTIRTSALANVLDQHGLSTFSIPLSYRPQNILFGNTGNVSPDVCWQSTSVCMTDEFLGGTLTSGNYGGLNWSQSSIGGACVVTTTNTASIARPGVIVLTTPTVLNQGCDFYLGNGSSSSSGVGPIGLNGGWSATYYLSTNPITTPQLRVGFEPPASTSVIPTNGIYFRFDTGLGDTTYMACFNTSGTETCFSTGLTATASYHKFSIASSTAGNVTFWVDGANSVTVCTTCTNVGTAPSATNLAPAVELTTSNASGAQLGLDWFNYILLGISR